MKRVLITIIILISGCSNTSVTDYPQFEQPREIMKWVYENIKYDFEKSNLLEWQSPEKTLSTHKGVCIDKSILMMKLLKDQFNIESELLIIETDKLFITHALVRYNNQTYDPTNNEYIYNADPVFVLNYQDTMIMSSNN